MSSTQGSMQQHQSWRDPNSLRNAWQTILEYCFKICRAESLPISVQLDFAAGVKGSKHATDSFLLRCPSVFILCSYIICLYQQLTFTEQVQEGLNLSAEQQAELLRSAAVTWYLAGNTSECSLWKHYVFNSLFPYDLPLRVSLLKHY